jgi:hypothetical protein
LGNIGGVFELLLLIFGFFIMPVSEHSFYLEAAKKLYFARTSNKNLLKKDLKHNTETPNGKREGRGKEDPGVNLSEVEEEES